MGDYWQHSVLGRILAPIVAAAMLLLGLGSMSGVTAAASAAPLPAPAPDPTTFVSTWNTNNTSTGSTNTRQVKLPLVNGGTYNFTVDWGDSTQDTITSWNSAAATHTYEAAGNYTIRITGTIRGFRFNNTGDRWKILEISSWGPLQFGSGGNYFYGAKNLVVTDTTAPNLTGVTSLSAAFYGATALTGDFSAWDTSGVTTLASMFRGAPNFTSDLSGWDVSNVRSLSGTFYGATSFDSDLSAWDVGAVTNMSNTFRGATSFSSSLADWDTSNVTLMGSMFRGATSFDDSVANWDVSSVTTMNSMFLNASDFNQSLAGPGWQPASLEDATAMLTGTSFDTDNYDALLESWGAADVQPTVTFDAGDALYTAGAPADGRAVLTGQYDWTITDGGERNVPDAPEEVSATGDDREALVQWTAPDANNSPITGYTVTGTPGGTCTATPPATSCTVTGLTNGTSYRFRVTATNAVGTSAESAQSNAVTPQVRPPGPPAKPHAVPRNQAATVTVERGDTGGAPDSYTVTSSPGNFQCTITVPATSCQVGGLTNGTSYTFTATATNNGGTSAASPVSDAVTPNPAAVMRWDTTETTSGSSTNRQVTLPLVSDGTYNFTVDWGDGSTSTITSYNQPAVTHTYAQAGEYTTTITGSLRGFRFNNTGDRAKLLDIESWGPVALGTPTVGKGHYFEGATNLQISATDAPDLTNTPDLSYTFSSADSLNSSLNNWDVSAVTDMEGMFVNADEFNGDITDWDTGSVTNMYSMFSNAVKFNQPIGDWDTSSVTDMSWMFRMGIFNQNINNWDVSNVTNMTWMFLHCQQYNQPLNDWDTSNVTNMHKMFEGAWVFNQPLDNWDTSDVTDMQGMFWNTRAFNQDLSAWDVSKVRNFYQMFSGAQAFRGDVSTWDIITDPTKTVTMAGMFQNSAYDPDLSAWNTSRVTDMSSMFQGNTAFDGGISGWDTSNVSQMVSMFSGATAFNESLADWDITALDDASSMLNNSGFGTANYNQTLISWARQAPPDVAFGANPTKYSTGDPAAARAELVRNGWTITDGGSTNQNVPGVPGNVTSSRTDNTATVSWSASVPNNSAVTGYFVTAWDIGASPATATDLGCSTNGALTCDVTGLAEGTTYGFTVYAQNAIGDSPSSLLETPGTPAAPVAVPGFESAYVGGYNVAAPGGAPSSYTITANPGGNTCTITVPATSCQVEGLTNGTPYTFTAQAHNDLGNSGVSAPSNAVTPAETFNSTWNTYYRSSGSTGSKQIKLPLTPTGTYNFTVYWGDGTSSEITSPTDVDATHTYPVAGIYNVAIQGSVRGWRFNNTGDRKKLFDITRWGGVRLDSPAQGETQYDDSYFAGATYLQITAEDAPNLSATTSLDTAFSGATRFNSSIDHWNVSNVTTMESMFANADAYNQSMNSWDTGNVTTMREMFSGADEFNGDITDWDTSAVTDMYGMFNYAPKFNQPIGDWATGNVTTMAWMFRMCTFNQNINNWDVSKVTSMNWMFLHCQQYNQPLNDWDTSSVTNLHKMFEGAWAFNQPLNNWDTSKVTDMTGLFWNTRAFDQDLSSWDFGRVTSMSLFLDGARGFTTGNYNRLLTSLAGQSTRSSVPLSAVYSPGIKYSTGAPATARATLVGRSWTITDGGSTTDNVPDVVTGVTVHIPNDPLYADVAWTAPAANGSPITRYTVTSTPGGLTCTSTAPATGCTVYDLDPETSYKFVVTATNAMGTSDPSAEYPFNVPATPNKPTAVAGDTSAEITVTDPGTGGPAESFVVTSVEDNTRTCTITVPDASCEVTGLTNGDPYTFTAIAVNNGGTSSASTASDPVTPLAPALDPAFGDVTPTADGFTVPITNYDPAFTWGTESSVPAEIVVNDQGTEDTADDTAELVVTGAGAAAYVQVNVTTARFGYVGGSSMVDGTSLEAARNPILGTPVRTADGFTAVITNYSPGWTWDATATYDEGAEDATARIMVDDQGTEATDDDTAELVVTGVPADTDADAVVTTIKADHADGRTEVSARSLVAALTPEFGTPAPTPDGFTVSIENYDPAFAWAATATYDSGAQDAAAEIVVDDHATPDPGDDTATLVITEVPADTASVAEVTTTREGYVRGSAEVSDTSLLAARNAEFGAVTRTDDGFRTPITNWNPDWTWSATATFDDGGPQAAGAQIVVDDQNTGTPEDDTARLEVSGVPASFPATAVVTSTRAGYAEGEGTVDGIALDPAWEPQLGTPVPSADGFTVEIENWDTDYNWALAAGYDTGGDPAEADSEITFVGGEQVIIVVSGVPADTDAFVDVTTTRADHADGHARAESTSLQAALTPDLGAAVPTPDGFTAPITNYDAAYTWAATATYTSGGQQPATAAVVVEGDAATLVVTGVPADTLATGRVTTARAGHAAGVATKDATSLKSALTPTLGSPTRTATGFTVQVSNYDDTYTWNATANAGSAAINGTGLVTVSGLTPNQLASVTVTTQRTGYTGGTASTSARALNAALTPTFDSPTPTANGFTVQITNYDGAYTWAGTATAGGSVAVNGTGLVTVTGVAADTSSTATITTVRTGFVDGSAQVSARSLKAALNPTYNTSVRTADGFTAQIRSYNNLYTYNATTNAGSVALSPTGLITVTGLTAGQLATVTVTTARSGYAPGSSTVAQRALFAALTPAFGTPSSTATGYTVQISNYSANYTWAGSATAGGSVSISGTGLVTVTGLNPGTSASTTVTAARSGYVTGTANVMGTSSTGAALTPSFSDLTRTAAGFNARIDNYDAAYTWNATATVGTAAIADGRVVVSGLGADVESVVTVTTARTGYSGGSAALTGKSLRTGLTPTLGTPTQTSDGYTVQVTNYDGNYTWTTNPTAGSAAINGSGLVTVSGLSAATSSTVTVTARRSGFTTGSAEATASSLATANTPQFGDVTRTSDGFTAPISNYDAQFTYGATTQLGSVSVSGSTVTVTGLNPGASTTATVTTTRSGYASGSNTVSGQALQGAPAAEFGTVTRTNDGFVVPISNYDGDFTWTPSTSVGSVSMNGVGVVTVSGLGVGQSATLTVVTTRSGFESASAEITRSSLSAALTPLFAAPSGTVDGFTVDVTNYDNSFSWQVSTSAGSASINGSGRVTVTGLGVDTPATVTVSTTKTGHRDGSAQASGRSLQTGLTPTYRTTTRTADGFTVPVRNYDAAYQWSVSTDVGSASISNSGLITVSGVPAGTLATVTTTTQRTGYTSGQSTIAQRALYAARTPTFGTPTRTATGYTVQITNYSTLFTWSAAATIGTATVSNTGLVTVSGLAVDGQTSTVTITSQRSGFADGTAQVTSGSEVG